MKICAITGSFDPFTSGHMTLVDKALMTFDEVHILVAANPDKHYMFSLKDRIRIIEDLFDTPEYENKVFVHPCHGLVVEWCYKNQVHTLVRGIRDANDMAYELRMADTNRLLANQYDGFFRLDTIFIPTFGDVANISSTLIREAIKAKDPIWEKFVPVPILISEILTRYRMDENFGKIR